MEPTENKYIMGLDVADPNIKDLTCLGVLVFKSGEYITEYTTKIKNKDEFLQAIDKIKEHYDKI